MSTTTLVRSDLGPAKALATAPRPVTTTPARDPRQTRKQRRHARLLQAHDESSTVLNPRVIDLQIRSAALWPRTYR
jgi:hypothetical protein